MKKSHVVSILNQKLTLRSDASDETVTQIAALVSDRVREVMDASKSASMLTAALLVCMNMAEELRRFEETRGVQNARTAQKVRDIIRLVDMQLGAGSQLAL
ncbi:MAG TPA: cell division protein ZapA [bacterium]|nr:cell division protein ZapA [bacterium]